MAHLQIYLLGNFCVTHDDQPVNLGYDKDRALLAYLAVENDRPIGREKLAALLWPDFPQAAAQEGLRQAISRLRKAIGDRTATTPFLLSTHHSLQLNPQTDYWVDVKAFRQTLADCAPPLSAATAGKRRKLPSPTALPATANITPSLLDHRSRLIAPLSSNRRFLF